MSWKTLKPSIELKGTAELGDTNGTFNLHSHLVNIYQFFQIWKFHLKICQDNSFTCSPRSLKEKEIKSDPKKQKTKFFHLPFKASILLWESEETWVIESFIKAALTSTCLSNDNRFMCVFIKVTKHIHPPPHTHTHTHTHAHTHTHTHTSILSLYLPWCV